MTAQQILSFAIIISYYYCYYCYHYSSFNVCFKIDSVMFSAFVSLLNSCCYMSGDHTAASDTVIVIST